MGNPQVGAVSLVGDYRDMEGGALPSVLASHSGGAMDDEVPDVPQPQEAEKPLMANERAGASVPALTTIEQDKGIKVIETWPREEIAFAAKLTVQERRLLVLAAALLDLRPASDYIADDPQHQEMT